MSKRTQSLHQRSVSEADIAVAQRVDAVGRVVPRGSAGLVRDADELEALASLGIDEVGALDFDGGDSAGEMGAGAECEELDL